jgi:adenylyltransferase/sulfurtransferase
MKCKPCILCSKKDTEIKPVAGDAPTCSVDLSTDSNPVLKWNDILKDVSKYVIFDIRNEAHYQMFRVRNSIHVHDIKDSIDLLKSYKKPIVICCYRGVGSLRIARILVEDGVEAYSADGGIEGFKKFINFEGL